ASFLLVMKPVQQDVQAVYTIYNGIRFKDGKSKKYDLIKSWCDEVDINIIEIETKSPTVFHEREQFYQYLTGILRLNHLLLPMTQLDNAVIFVLIVFTGVFSRDIWILRY